MLYCTIQEPTSGLDSATAYNLISTLDSHARDSDRTIMTTIHQPCSQIFHMFPNVLLLHEGQVAYRQWRSRTFGRLVRWSNLPPYCLRFWKVEPDAVKGPIKPTIALAVRLRFYCTRKHEISRGFFFTIFANLPPPSKCRLVRPALPAPPLPLRYASEYRQIQTLSIYNSAVRIITAAQTIVITSRAYCARCVCLLSGSWSTTKSNA